MPHLNEDAIRALFLDARSHSHWLPRDVEPAQLNELYALFRMGPTAANSCPLRVVFVHSAIERDRLIACVSPSNAEKTRTAPVTAVLAMDVRFHEKLPKLFPHNPDAPSWFNKDEAVAERAARLNASIEIGYFILAARAIGLDCGPMGGFDAAKVDAAFLAGTSWKSLVLCNVGYADASKLFPRNPRLEFDEACRIV